jgi:hypothetical protein
MGLEVRQLLGGVRGAEVTHGGGLNVIRGPGGMRE